ncbi:ead/Ea22-like family protein [Citrobacter freundii]|nr:ead/Ea22-like family protein [Citrobacter freundii]MDH0766920.1 ead/Ea22-like family protein [Citrobacter freundii]MDH1967869.1 ead/Ea22-like family protein [Citrobacter freundii]
MTALNKQALRVPERKRRDWSQAVMRDCDFCSQWALTVKHDDGGHICASCCDDEYTSELKCALESAIDRAEAAEKRIAEQSEIVAAAEKLVRCKGRYHSELNYRALAKLFGVTTPDLPPLEHDNVHYADAAEMEIAALRQRIAELSASHSKLREGMAAIYNAICKNGASTSLSAILTFVKRLREESATAAGIGVKGE